VDELRWCSQHDVRLAGLRPRRLVT
jgi:hypothetical protein